MALYISMSTSRQLENLPNTRKPFTPQEIVTCPHPGILYADDLFS
jgi:hypothetical protein